MDSWCILDPAFTDEPAFDLSTRATGFFPSTSHPKDIRVHVTNHGVDKNTNFNLQVTCFPT